jgi:hypothetical protein
VQVAVGTVEQRQPVARVSAAHQALDDLLGFAGKWPVAVSEDGWVQAGDAVEDMHQAGGRIKLDLAVDDLRVF